jgi:hypothetical protein
MVKIAHLEEALIAACVERKLENFLIFAFRYAACLAVFARLTNVQFYGQLID